MKLKFRLGAVLIVTLAAASENLAQDAALRSPNPLGISSQAGRERIELRQILHSAVSNHLSASTIRKTPAEVAKIVERFESGLSQTEVGELAAFYRTSLGSKSLAKSLEAGATLGSIQTQQVTPPPMDRETRKKFLQAKGFDPNKHDFDPATGDVFEVEPEPEKPKPIELPASVRYIVTVSGPNGNEMYFANAEPKPFGGGYKFFDPVRDTELVVSGVVTILKASKGQPTKP